MIQVVLNLFNANASLNTLTKKIITKRWQDQISKKMFSKYANTKNTSICL